MSLPLCPGAAQRPRAWKPPFLQGPSSYRRAVGTELRAKLLPAVSLQGWKFSARWGSGVDVRLISMSPVCCCSLPVI